MEPTNVTPIQNPVVLAVRELRDETDRQHAALLEIAGLDHAKEPLVYGPEWAYHQGLTKAAGLARDALDAGA